MRQKFIALVGYGIFPLFLFAAVAKFFAFSTFKQIKLILFSLSRLQKRNNCTVSYVHLIIHQNAVLYYLI
jgi:hypothetical protein